MTQQQQSDLEWLLQSGHEEEIRAFVKLLRPEDLKALSDEELKPLVRFIHREELQVLLDASEETTRGRLITSMHPSSIADLLIVLPSPEWRPILEFLDGEQLSAVLAELEEPEVERVLEHIERQVLPDLLSEMDSDDAADILGELTHKEAQEILQKMDAEDAAPIQALLKYDDESAGGLMQTELVCVQVEGTADTALQEIRQQVADHDGALDFHEVFVVDEDHRLQGQFSLEVLITAQPQAPIRTLIDPDLHWALPEMDQEEVAALFERYDLIALPVVDANRRLLGRITVDDIVDVIKEEASEDILQMAGAGGEDLVADRTVRSAMLRLPWLITNLFGGLLTGYLMWMYKATLDQILALITFVPVITGMGGNVGTQSASVTIRGFALGRIDLTNIRRFLWKEMRVGALMGTICGTGLTLIGWIWHHNAYLGLVVGLSLFVAMTFASSMGTLIPALFERYHIDPALASGPFVTTLNDVSGILIYLSTATFCIRWLH